MALRYRQDLESAPRVLAKGQGDLAERIIALAQASGVPLHEDRDLIGLLAALELDELVPPALYAVLAEVLAHVYRANRAAS
jgi:flagellar biosynthesis protein